MILSVLSVVVCVLLVSVNGDAEVKSEHDLRSAIFENYDHLVRPVRNAADAIPVRAAIVPVGIKDVDVKDKIVKLDTWFYLKWHDDYLTWDPSLYGGLEALRIPASEVWTPDITIYTSTPDTSSLPSVHTNVVLFSNGTVLWVPPFTVKSRCPIAENQVSEDTFKCTISAGSWTYDVTLLDLHEYYEDVLQHAREDAFQDTHKEWTLESMTARTEQKHYSCCVEAYPVIRFDLLFRKRHDEVHHDH